MSLCCARNARICGILSPGSTTIASPLASSPRIVQLHCRGPTGNVLRIMLLLSRDVNPPAPIVEKGRPLACPSIPKRFSETYLLFGVLCELVVPDSTECRCVV